MSTRIVLLLLTLVVCAGAAPDPATAQAGVIDACVQQADVPLQMPSTRK